MTRPSLDVATGAIDQHPPYIRLCTVESWDAIWWRSAWSSCNLWRRRSRRSIGGVRLTIALNCSLDCKLKRRTRSKNIIRFSTAESRNTFDLPLSWPLSRSVRCATHLDNSFVNASQPLAPLPQWGPRSVVAFAGKAQDWACASRQGTRTLGRFRVCDAHLRHGEYCRTESANGHKRLEK